MTNTYPANIIRWAISAFILVLLGLSLAGWSWAGANLAGSQATAGRAVLTIGMAAGLVGLRALWRR